MRGLDLSKQKQTDEVRRKQREGGKEWDKRREGATVVKCKTNEYI